MSGRTRDQSGGGELEELTIKCTQCGNEIRLTESLAAPLIEATRKQYERQLAAKDSEVAAREAELRDSEAALSQKRAALDEEIAARLLGEQKRIAAEEAAKARKVVAADLDAKDAELATLQESLTNSASKIAELSRAQADLMRGKRELESEREALELSVERRVAEELDTVKSQARREAEDGLRLKVSEKEEQISGMQRQIEELRRRAEQGSQQLQGEVQELDLEKLLAATFPMDRIEPVPKGEFGGDALQRVLGPFGQSCGTILWESKRTKNWSDGWLQKLRDDQRAAKAELAVLVTLALPKGVETFGLVDGIWVAHPRAAIAVAVALRQTLLEVAAARKSSDGQQTKMELLYDYLIGPHFRQRVQAIVESFSSMQDDLNKERKVITKQWAKREAQLARAMQSTVGMYGDMQGIAGRALSDVEGLSLEEDVGGHLLAAGADAPADVEGLHEAPEAPTSED